MNHEEHYLQCAVIKWFRLAYPNQLLFAIPNAHVRSPRQGAWMKAEGMTAGMPDLFLAFASDGWNGLFIELKSAKGKCSPAQTAIISQLHNNDYKVKICRTLEEVQSEIKVYFHD